MEWEEDLKNRLVSGDERDKIYQLCLNAFMEGRQMEKAMAIEAYRLRCADLFGNRCMNHSRSSSGTHAICTGNCSYVKRYWFELNKLES